MHTQTPLAPARRFTALLAVLLAALLVVADCERDPGPYNPKPGDTIWRSGVR